ncbi:hypothetical protein NDU88_004093 [Pleurodeles waltl]|uniref:Putative nuclease HARBI1 n=1 Tax=Pleurodeles waltl TaxID=8319 RepID=A0AAV7RKI3_PLEWA|nr:hypothetical protein NDU88_004093 [Pleurodeles waltl]
MAVTSAAVRTATAGALRHWLLKRIGFNVNQCGFAPRSSTAYRHGVPRQRIDLTSHCHTSQAPSAGPCEEVEECSRVQTAGGPVDNGGRHVILTYRLDRATIQELCAQLEPDLMSPIRQPTGIPPLVQVMSVLHFLARGSFQTTVAISSGMSQPMFSKVLSRVLSALLKHMRRYIVFPEVGDLPTVKSDFYALGHIPNIIGAIDGTHVALVPPRESEQVYRNRKSYHSMNVQVVCLADQYISHVNAKFPGSVHDVYIMRNSSIPYVMEQLQRHRVWLIGDSGYPNLSWLLTPVRNPRTSAEERYNEAHGRTRRVMERTFGLLKARFRCLHMTGGSLMYSPRNVSQIIVACCMLHNLALRRQVPFLQEDGPDGGVVAAVEPVESDEEEDEEDDTDNRDTVIQQYFQ